MSTRVPMNSQESLSLVRSTWQSGASSNSGGQLLPFQLCGICHGWCERNQGQDEAGFEIIFKVHRLTRTHIRETCLGLDKDAPFMTFRTLFGHVWNVLESRRDRVYALQLPILVPWDGFDGFMCNGTYPIHPYPSLQIVATTKHRSCAKPWQPWCSLTLTRREPWRSGLGCGLRRLRTSKDQGFEILGMIYHLTILNR